jgi:hypothetical protein
MESLSALGLIAIVIGWILQFLSTSVKKHEFNPLFLIFYALGSGILAYTSFQSGSILTAILNFAVFVLPVAIMLKISK